MALPIPDDWDGVTHQILTITVPDSHQWRGIVKGKIYELTDTWRWDDDTGDPDDAVEIAWPIFESLLGWNESINRFRTGRDGFEFYSKTGSGAWTVYQSNDFDGSAMVFDPSGESVGDKCIARKSVNITIESEHKLLAYFWSPGEEKFRARYRLRDESDSVIAEFSTGSTSEANTDNFLYFWQGSVIKTIEVEAEVVDVGGMIFFEYVDVVLV